ncbi:MAG TPA: glycosyltransferase family 4 protein [Dehalococcoidia bacterium]|nr:glycosyltransferase family 4 protein [Dehalococcoidia bacterium]
MKKVLIIARYFGTRIPALVKYLPGFGWQPVLLTTALPPDSDMPPEIAVIETGSRTESHFAPAAGRSILDRFLAVGGEIVNYPDSYKGWKDSAIRAGDDLLRKDNFDAVISSSSPITAHLIAGELKSRHGLPWLADLRDLWSQNHNYYYSPLRRAFDRRLEHKTLSAADALVTVSRPWADRLAKLHPGKKIYAITNGYDADMTSVTPSALTSKFTVSYTGNIYRGKQSPARLFTPLRSLISEGAITPDDVEVRFYGPALAWLDKEINKAELSGIVRQYGTVSRQVAVEKQRESQVLWLMDWDDPTEDGWYPLKIFEYLGTGRPVLATGGAAGSAVDRLLAATKGGVHAITVEDIKNTLRDLYNEYKLKGEVSCYGLREEIGKYTHREMTGRFVTVLEGLLER